MRSRSGHGSRCTPARSGTAAAPGAPPRTSCWWSAPAQRHAGRPPQPLDRARAARPAPFRGPHGSLPVPGGSARGKGSLADVRGLAGRRQAARRRERPLRAENARLKQRNQTLEAAAAEADGSAGSSRSRKDAGARPRRRGDRRLPSARFDTLTIARGTRDGVREGLAARTPDGLLARSPRRRRCRAASCCSPTPTAAWARS
jgi:hypothetical protein